jgi:hypothetical protein
MAMVQMCGKVTKYFSTQHVLVNRSTSICTISSPQGAPYISHQAPLRDAQLHTYLARDIRFVVPVPSGSARFSIRWTVPSLILRVPRLS